MAKIEKLVLKNFKSFKKAEIPISPGFTVIAGSNGSGKSNIFDALMFAMGATSLKMLRASRLTDLVNNSATENYGKVDLFLKHNGEKYEISRMIDRQGRSVFRLNGEKKTLSEVSSLLNEIGLNPYGHNIVLQGDITKVVEMSPDERRGIIDEIAGLSEFDAKKVEALKELGKVEAKIKEANIVLNERENYLADLEKERNAAMEFEQLEKEKKMLKATLLSREIEKISGLLNEAETKSEKIAVEKESVEKSRLELDSGLRELKQGIEELGSELMQNSEQTYGRFGPAFEEAKAARGLCLHKIESMKSAIAKNSAKTRSLDERMAAINSEMQQQEEELASAERRMPELEKEIAELEFKRKRIASEQGKMEERFLGFDNDLSELADEINDLRKRFFEKHAEIEAVKKGRELRKSMLEDSLREMEEIKKILDEKNEKKRLLDSLHSRFKQPEAELAELRRTIEKTLYSLKQAESRAEELKKAANELKKSKSSCPVCESPLKEDKKRLLYEKKQAQAKALFAESGKLEGQLEKLSSKRADLEEAVVREKVLKNDAADPQRVKEKAEMLGKKIAALKQMLDTAQFDEKQSEANRLKEQIAALEKEKARKEASKQEFKRESNLSALQETTDSLNELRKEKYLLEQLTAEIIEAGSERLKKQRNETVAEIKSIKEENDELEKRIRAENDLAALKEHEIANLEAEIEKAEQKTKKLSEEKSLAEKKRDALEERIEALKNKARRLELQENELRVESGKFGVRIDDLKEEYREFEGVEVLKAIDGKELQTRIAEAEKRTAELGAINMRAIESFEELKSEVSEMRQKTDKLESERLAVLDMIDKIEVKRTEVFTECFRKINKNFEEMFFALFAGEGRLSLSNEENPLEAGLIIEAKHKGENLKNIDSMSGGEKTLTALAFLFAIQLYESAPLYIFDEADAALDKENSSKLLNIIKQVSRQAQFIAISHNDPLINAADQIIGVALNKQKSSVIGLKLKDNADKAIIQA